MYTFFVYDRETGKISYVSKGTSKESARLAPDGMESIEVDSFLDPDDMVVDLTGDEPVVREMTSEEIAERDANVEPIGVEPE